MPKPEKKEAQDRRPRKPLDDGQAALRLVSTPEFAAIWKQLNDRFVSRSEFNAMPMPAGADADAVWAVTRNLLKGAGTTLNHPAWFSKDAEESMWYYTPKSMEDRIRSIQQRTANESDLGIRLDKFKSIPLCYSLMADELQSVLADDNVNLSRDQLQRVFLHGRPPLPPKSKLQPTCGSSTSTWASSRAVRSTARSSRASTNGLRATSKRCSPRQATSTTRS